MIAARTTGITALVALVFLMASCGGAGGDSTQGSGQGTEAAPADGGQAGEGLTSVTWGVSIRVPTPGQSPYSSVPLALGYWAEEGLDVEVQGFSGSGAVFQAIDANQIDVGQGPPSALFPAVAQGAEMVAFYDHVPRNFLLPAVPEDSDITTVADFEGQTIGVASLEAGGVPLIRAMAVREGMPADALDIVAIGTGSEALSFVERGEVDVVSLWDSAYAQLENLGLPLRIVSNDFFENLGFHNAMVTTKTTFEDRRDVMLGLGRGVAKATAFAHENPEAAVCINWELYPESKPSGVPEEEALAAGVRELEARNENTRPLEDTWGYSSEDIIADHMEVLLDAGVISEAVDVEDLWTDELLDEINDFDEGAIREQARNYEC